MSRPQLSIALAVATLCGAIAAVGAYTSRGPGPAFATITVVTLAAAAVLAVGVLVGFARPGALERVEDRARLEHAAHTDQLTGLGNVRAFQEDLAREIARARGASETLGLVLLDVDGLKLVNDRSGHQAGDEMLKAVAVAMSGAVRRRETAYRIGGDEFAVILPRETNWGAFRFAQRLQAEFATTASLPVRLSAAAGVTAYRGQTRDALIREADLALIAAKRGRRGVMLYTDDLAVREQGYDSGRDDYFDLISAALARAVDERERTSRGHSEVVAELSAQIARELGFSLDRITQIRRAALLHDVGKISVTDAVLGKVGRLTESEREEIRSHPEMGFRIVTGMGLRDEARWVLHHHERPDGSGYPGGLVGAEIPIEAKIIATAEAFDAMVGERPYGATCSSEEALAELERCVGHQFDGAVVAALADVLRSERRGDVHVEITNIPTES